MDLIQGVVKLRVDFVRHTCYKNNKTVWNNIGFPGQFQQKFIQVSTRLIQFR